MCLQEYSVREYLLPMENITYNDVYPLMDVWLVWLPFNSKMLAYLDNTV